MGRGNWYKKWLLNRGFILENDMLKSKSYIYTTMPKANQFGYQNGNIRGIIASDIYARFDRLNDYNVLFPLGFDTLASSSFQESKKNNNLLDDEIPNLYIEELKELGIGINDYKLINMRHDEYLVSLQEAFIDLYEKGYIIYKNRMLYEDNETKKVYDDFSKPDDIDYSKVKIKSFSLDISSVAKEVYKTIVSLDIKEEYKTDIIKRLGLKRNLLMSLSLSNKNKLNIKLDKPEYLGGLSFIVLNPNLIDCDTYISEQEKENVKLILESNYPFADSGLTALNPLTGRQIPIFISTSYKEAIYLVFPGAIEDDRLLQEAMELEYIDIISNGLLINSDFLDGMSINDAHNEIINVFLDAGIASVEEEFENTLINLSSQDGFGPLFPFLYDRDLGQINSLKGFLPYNFSEQFRPVLNDKTNISGLPLKGSINSLFVDGMAPILSINYDEYSSSDSIFSEEFISLLKEWIPISILMVDKSNILSNLVMPIIFNEIIKKETNYTINGLFTKVIIIPETLDYTYTKLLRCNNNTLDIKSLLKQYYSDSVRFYFMTSELDEDLIYDDNMLSKIDLYVKRVEHTLLNVCDIDSSRMDYHFKEFITKCKEYLSKRELSKYINYVKSFTDMYILKEMYNYNQLLLYLIAIYPLMPFLAEEIYEEKFSKKNSIINEGWI